MSNASSRPAPTGRISLCRALAVSILFAMTFAALAEPTPSVHVKRSTWVESLVASWDRTSAAVSQSPIPRMDFMQNVTAMIWFRTEGPGALFAKSPAADPWTEGGKLAKIEFDRIGVDTFGCGQIWPVLEVRDGAWHHFAFVGEMGDMRLYLDGKRIADGRVRRCLEPAASELRIGFQAENWPDGVNGFRGELDEMRIYRRALTEEEIAAHFNAEQPDDASGLVAFYRFEGDARDSSPAGNHADETIRCAYVPGKRGRALRLEGDGGRVVVRNDGKAAAFLEAFWERAAEDFASERDLREMAWEREDGIWDGWRAQGDYAALARRYAAASYRREDLAAEARRMADSADSLKRLLIVRALYLQSRRADATDRILRFRDPKSAVGVVESLRRRGLPDAAAEAALARLKSLEERAKGWIEGPMPAPEVEAWTREFDETTRNAMLADSTVFDFEEILFVKRMRYTSNHYYTDYVNSAFTPGGNICALNLRTGEVREIVQGLEGGVFGKFDLSFDAQKLVFAWKKSWGEGYRIYTCNVDGSDLRQITFPPEDEEELQRKYRVGYHHGTDDMHPCWLPDGGIAFISTRCQFGILCDSPDDFTTTVVYRMDADGSNMEKLTNSSVSEAAPSVANDGRILYTRWEYVDKGAVSVKCIWSMHPDGSGTNEVYGDNVFVPPSLTQVRALPGSNNEYVMIGCPHFSQNAVGTVIRLDATKDPRTREPMTYMTPDVDILGEGGYWWDPASPWGERVFKGPYPMTRDLFLVAMTNGGWEGYLSRTDWNLHLLDEKGRTMHFYSDPEIGAFHPMPFKPRLRPPVLPSARNPKLAAKGLAHVVVTDVEQGMTGIEPGTVRYLRVNEQAPRPWSARRLWGGDEYDQQHAVITKDTNLGLKVQHGVVPVEEDGSASFYVQADRNIFLQALDENFMEVQRERTYVNYRPGESRSCVGCHERPDEVPPSNAPVLKALLREPSMPGPQPGEERGARPLYYANDVQPVLDKHCVSCHGGEKPKGNLNLSGEMTDLFSVSYEQMIPERRGGSGRPFDRFPLIGPTIGENHPKDRNVQYLPPMSLGSHASVLASMLNPKKVDLRKALASVEGQAKVKRGELARLKARGEEARWADIRALEIEIDELQGVADRIASGVEPAKRLAEVHKGVELSREEMIRLTTWIDSNGQYYGSWYGRRNLRYKDHPNFRPMPTFEDAVTTTSPLPWDQR